MIENVIFDLDGTLVDSIEGIQYSLSKAICMEFPDFIIQIDIFRKIIGQPIDQICKNLLPQISENEQLKIVKNFRMIYDQIGWKKTCPFPTVLDMLEVLSQKGINIFIATNKPSLPTAQILAFTGIISFLKESISPDFDEKQRWGKSDLVKTLMEKYSLSVYNTLMIGDTKNDAQASQDCGLKFIFASYGYGVKKEFGKYFLSGSITQPLDLLSIIKELNHES